MNNKQFCIFVKILLESGLRCSNLEAFIKSFEPKKAEIRGDIIVYPLFDINGKKGSFYLFMKKNTYDEFLIHQAQFKHFNLTCLKRHIRYNKLLSLKYLRKYQFTQMIKVGISLEVADFIQGRASKNIGFNHYLAKKEIAVKGYSKLL